MIKLKDPRIMGLIFGAIFGALFVIAEYLIGLYFMPGFTVTEQHKLHPALLLIDTAPLVLGAAGYFLGAYFLRAYSAARRSEAIMDAITTAPVSFMLCDGEAPYPVIHVNEGFEALTGYSREEAIGKPCDYLQGDAREENSEALARLRHAIEHREGVTVTMKNFRKDGRPMWVELKIFPLSARDGTWSMLAGLQTDVTQERRMVRHIGAFNYELGRWRRVFLSRENRNLALKSEVDQLRSRLGLPPKYPMNALKGATPKMGDN